MISIGEGMGRRNRRPRKENDRRERVEKESSRRKRRGDAEGSAIVFTHVVLQ